MDNDYLVKAFHLKYIQNGNNLNVDITLKTALVGICMVKYEIWKRFGHTSNENGCAL